MKSSHMPTTLTITFSPCIDKNMDVAELIPEKKLVCSSPVLSPGGGGINVARVLQRLGKEVVAIYPSGGYTGKYLNDMMNDQRVASLTVNTAEATRENIIITETASGKQYRFGAPPVILTAIEYEQLMREVERIVSFRYLVVSGSFPPGTGKDAIAHLSLLARKRKARLIVDTKGEPLQQALDAGVFLIKPNLGELAALTQRNFLESDEIEAAARELLQKYSCEAIAISMGEGGAMLVTKDSAQQIPAPSVKRISTVGAGDSLVAGVIAGLTDNHSLYEAVRLGVACGTAATLKKGSELCEPDDAFRLLTQMNR